MLNSNKRDRSYLSFHLGEISYLFILRCRVKSLKNSETNDVPVREDQANAIMFLLLGAS